MPYPNDSTTLARAKTEHTSKKSEPAHLHRVAPLISPCLAPSHSPSLVDRHELGTESLDMKDRLRAAMHAMIVERGLGDDLVLDLIVDALQQHVRQRAHDDVRRDGVGEQLVQVRADAQQALRRLLLADALAH